MISERREIHEEMEKLRISDEMNSTYLASRDSQCFIYVRDLIDLFLLYSESVYSESFPKYGKVPRESKRNT